MQFLVASSSPRTVSLNARNPLLVVVVVMSFWMSASFRVEGQTAFPTSTTSSSPPLQFPSLFNVAQNRPISTSPSAATCGVQTVDGYCASSSASSSVTGCQLSVCSQSCPYRSATPTYVDLLSPPPPPTPCVSADYVNVRPGTSTRTSASTLFISISGSINSQQCSVASSTVPTLGNGGSLTLSFWVWLNSASVGLVHSIIRYVTFYLRFPKHLEAAESNRIYE
jgi:hypothetical protein